MSVNTEPTPEGIVLNEKPPACVAAEEKVRDELVGSGIDQVVANAVLGYRLTDLPFIYGTLPAAGLLHGSRLDADKWNEGNPFITGESCVWFASTLPIYDLEAKSGWADQIPEVVAEWHGLRYDAEDALRITRTEIHHMPDGRFVKVEYTEVSRMGALDGNISRITLHIPSTIPAIRGGRPRGQYEVRYFIRLEDGTWEERDRDAMSVCPGTRYYASMLDAYSQAIHSHLGSLHPVKETPGVAYSITLPDEIGSPIRSHEYSPPQPVFKPERAGAVHQEVQLLAAELAPGVVRALAEGAHVGDATRVIAGIALGRTEGLDLPGVDINAYSREMRFGLAQHLAQIVDRDYLAEWAGQLLTADGAEQLGAVCDKFTNDLANWLSAAKETVDLHKWVQNARSDTEGKSIAKEHLYAKQQMTTVLVGQMLSFAASVWLRANEGRIN